MAGLVDISQSLPHRCTSLRCFLSFLFRPYMAPKQPCAKYQYVVTPAGPKIVPVLDAYSKDEESPADYNSGGYLQVKINDTFKDDRYLVLRKLGYVLSCFCHSLIQPFPILISPFENRYEPFTHITRSAGGIFPPYGSQGTISKSLFPPSSISSSLPMRTSNLLSDAFLRRVASPCCIASRRCAQNCFLYMTLRRSLRAVNH